MTSSPAVSAKCSRIGKPSLVTKGRRPGACYAYRVRDPFRVSDVSVVVTRKKR